MQHVVLIPGFFGFTGFGGLTYFAHLVPSLSALLEQAGLRAEVHIAATRPTASLPARASALLRSIGDSVAADGGDIHLVGHSTGGLDARLLLSPGVALPDVDSDAVESIAARVRSVVSVCTPHYGTPLARFFTTVFGQKLLRVLSLVTVYVLRSGPLPLSVLLELSGLFIKLDDYIGLTDTIADEVFDELLGRFSDDERDKLEAFFAQTGAEQTLMAQLTPECAELFNATVRDRASVRYASVISSAPRPGIGSVIASGLDPYAQASHLMFRGLYSLTARHEGCTYAVAPDLPADRVDVASDRSAPPSASDNDAIVPTLSQIYGEVLRRTRADHLDVIGHYNAPSSDPPVYDWLVSHADFDRARFDAVWHSVADFIARTGRSSGNVKTGERAP